VVSQSTASRATLQCKGERGGIGRGGGVWDMFPVLLPSPEETATSGTSPGSSDGARSPQTSEEKESIHVQLFNTCSKYFQSKNFFLALRYKTHRQLHL